MYSQAVIISVMCLCRPCQRFDATDTKFPLINQFILISASLVVSIPIWVSMGIGKSVRNPLMLVVPVLLSFTLGGINGGFVLWDDSPNLLER